MPSGNFQVESYESTVRGRFGNARRRIDVVSPGLSHGIRNRALLFFYEAGTLPPNEGFAYNVGGLNFNGITVIGYLPLSDFEAVRTILQTEAPVTVNYYYKDLASSPSSTTKELTGIIVGTDKEPPGEGPVDPESVPVP